MRDIVYTPHIRGKPEIIIPGSFHHAPNAGAKSRSPNVPDVLCGSGIVKLPPGIPVTGGNAITKVSVEGTGKCTLKIRGHTLKSRERRICYSAL